jgi:hypothetical protein
MLSRSAAKASRLGRDLTTPQKAGIGAFCQLHIFGQWRTCAIVASDHPHQEQLMPLMLTEAERAMLDALAAPIDAERRPEFLGVVTTKLEAAGPAAVGPGALHRTARTVLRDFWDPPPDLRQNRVGPRGPRT